MSAKGTILVVEDQESARESLVELLRGEGYDVHEAADGEEGIKKISQLDVDVVLTDLMMPGADGLANLRQRMREIGGSIEQSSHFDGRPLQEYQSSRFPPGRWSVGCEIARLPRKRTVSGSCWFFHQARGG